MIVVLMVDDHLDDILQMMLIMLTMNNNHVESD